MSDTDWQLIVLSGHWDCLGWSRDSRDGVLRCACGAVIREPEGTAAA